MTALLVLLSIKKNSKSNTHNNIANKDCSSYQTLPHHSALGSTKLTKMRSHEKASKEPEHRFTESMYLHLDILLQAHIVSLVTVQ